MNFDIQDVFGVFIIFVFGCFGIWFLVGAVLPILNYLVTGTARTISIDKRWNLILRGRKAKLFLLCQFCLSVCGILWPILLFIFKDIRFLWLFGFGFFVFFSLMLFLTTDAERLPRKTFFFEKEDFWHS